MNESALKAKPELKVRLGGKLRTYALDLNAVRAWEEKTGKSFMFDINWQRMSMTQMMEIVWAAGLTNDPDLTFDEFCKLVTIDSVAEFKPLVDEIIARASAAQKQIEESEQSEVEEKNVVTQ